MSLSDFLFDTGTATSLPARTIHADADFLNTNDFFTIATGCGGRLSPERRRLLQAPGIASGTLCIDRILTGHRVRRRIGGRLLGEVAGPGGAMLRNRIVVGLLLGQNFIDSFLLLDARLTALMNLLSEGIGHALQAQIIIAALV